MWFYVIFDVVNGFQFFFLLVFGILKRNSVYVNMPFKTLCLAVCCPRQRKGRAKPREASW